MTDVFLVGLAYDFCVGYSALDALACGYGVTVVSCLQWAVWLCGSGGHAWVHCCHAMPCFTRPPHTYADH